MKFFSRFGRLGAARNPHTVFARQRLGRTMPGETGALAASRLGFLVS